MSAHGGARNGANLQPWHFVVVSGDPAVKRQIRVAAEAEEAREFYSSRAPGMARRAGPVGHRRRQSAWNAPYLIAIFAQSYGLLPDGRKVKHLHYYVAGPWASPPRLPHRGYITPAWPRSPHTQPHGLPQQDPPAPAPRAPVSALLVVGYPADDAQVPAITKKPLDEIATFV
ncbi:MAG: hypothetical protein R2854_03925 [Caldilineaceae bacterium]